MSAGRIVLLVFGILFVLGSFGLLISGGVVLTVDNAFKDDRILSPDLPINSDTRQSSPIRNLCPYLVV